MQNNTKPRVFNHRNFQRREVPCSEKIAIIIAPIKFSDRPIIEIESGSVNINFNVSKISKGFRKYYLFFLQTCLKRASIMDSGRMSCHADGVEPSKYSLPWILRSVVWERLVLFEQSISSKLFISNPLESGHSRHDIFFHTLTMLFLCRVMLVLSKKKSILIFSSSIDPKYAHLLSNLSSQITSPLIRKKHEAKVTNATINLLATISEPHYRQVFVLTLIFLGIRSRLYLKGVSWPQPWMLFGLKSGNRQSVLKDQGQPRRGFLVYR
jgi:hypothetical protein